MFSRWRTKIATARTTVKATTSHGRPVSTSSTGISAATVSDAREE
jgi:hypothetical protein